MRTVAWYLRGRRPADDVKGDWTATDANDVTMTWQYVNGGLTAADLADLVAALMALGRHLTIALMAA